MGYGSKIITITGTDAGTVQLVKEAITQEDVVVVGYATIKRKDLTGTVSSVNAKQLKDIPLSSAAEALQGRLAGVQAIASEGTPGADIISGLGAEVLLRRIIRHCTLLMVFRLKMLCL